MVDKRVLEKTGRPEKDGPVEEKGCLMAVVMIWPKRISTFAFFQTLIREVKFRVPYGKDPDQ